MTICNVLKTISVGDNTAIVVDGSGDLFRNGTGILDEKGKPYEVLSVGMDMIVNEEDRIGKTTLLLTGDFLSSKIYV